MEIDDYVTIFIGAISGVAFTKIYDYYFPGQLHKKISEIHTRVLKIDNPKTTTKRQELGKYTNIGRGLEQREHLFFSLTFFLIVALLFIVITLFGEVTIDGEQMSSIIKIKIVTSFSIAIIVIGYLMWKLRKSISKLEVEQQASMTKIES